MFIVKTNDTIADLLLHSQRKFEREKIEYCSGLLIKGIAHTSYLSILVHHHIYLSSVKVHQKAGKEANICQKGVVHILRNHG